MNCSSQFNQDKNCQKAVDRKLDCDHEWASARDDGKDAWVEIMFTSLYVINYTQIMQRFNIREQFKDVQLLFDDHFITEV